MLYHIVVRLDYVSVMSSAMSVLIASSGFDEDMEPVDLEPGDTEPLVSPLDDVGKIIDYFYE